MMQKPFLRSYERYLFQFCSERNISVRYLEISAESGWLDAVYLRPAVVKKTVVVFHSLGADRLYPFTELFVGLLERQYAIVSIDWDGHGTGQTHRLSFPAILHSPLACIDFALQELSIAAKDIVVLGHSYGGVLALLEACQQRCAGVVTISTPHKVQPNWKLVAELWALFSRHCFRQLQYYSLYDLLPACYGFKRNVFPCRTLPANEHYIQNVVRILADIDILAKVSVAKIPLLQIHGALDMLVPVAQAYDIQHTYGSTDKSLLVLPLNTHFSTVFSKTATKALFSWLENISQRHDSIFF